MFSHSNAASKDKFCSPIGLSPAHSKDII